MCTVAGVYESMSVCYTLIAWGWGVCIVLHRNTLAASYSKSGALVSYWDAPSSHTDRSRHQQLSALDSLSHIHTHTRTKQQQQNIFQDKNGDSSRINWNLLSPVTPVKQSRPEDVIAVDAMCEAIMFHYVFPLVHQK